MRLRPGLVTAGLFAFVTWTGLLLLVVLPVIGHGNWQTSTYWVAPRLVWDGAEHLLWDPVAFGDAAVRLGAIRDMGFLPHPPVGVLPLLPFGLLTQPAAFLAWTALGLGALVLALLLLLAALRFSGTAALVAVGLVPLFRPLRANIGEGQAYIFLLVALLLAAAWAAKGDSGDRSAERRAWTDVGAGLALGAMGILKLYYGLVLLLPALVQRRWAIAATAVIGLAAAAAVTVMAWGFEGWATWFDDALSSRTRPQTTVTAYQTLLSVFGRLLRYDATWNPGPIVDLPGLVDILWFATVAVVVGVSVFVFARYRRTVGRGLILLPLAATVPVELLLSPGSQDTHYVLMILPLIVAGWSLAPVGALDRAVSGGRPNRATLVGWALLALTGMLLAAPWSPNAPDGEGWAALLRYPRVYGALLLWGLLLWIIWRAGERDGAGEPARAWAPDWGARGT